MFVFPFRYINELLTWLVVSPECHSAWASVDPGPVLESTSCIKKHKANKTAKQCNVAGKTRVIPGVLWSSFPTF